MTFWAGLFRGGLCLVACLVLSGCGPAGSGSLDEEKEPHFLAGKSRVGTLDYEGAIECFEKALQANPRSASAHFELAWLFEQKEMDPSAAIYHYQRYLKLRPGVVNAEDVNQRIMACKEALAKTVSMGPVTDRLQHQLEQATEEIKRLTEDNKRLREDLDKWSSYAGRLQTLTNQSRPATVLAARVAPAGSPLIPGAVQPQENPARTYASSTSLGTAARTHTVKAGDTLALIARKYGVKLETLLTANPNLEPRRLRIGQTLRVPGS